MKQVCCVYDAVLSLRQSEAAYVEPVRDGAGA
jgi:hypothetical protein